MARIRAPRLALGTLLLAIAALALLLAACVPVVKRVFFPSTWNTWIVKTVTRPDGAVVRVRIRRYPDRDVVFEEVLSGPGASARRPGQASASAPPE